MLGIRRRWLFAGSVVAGAGVLYATNDPFHRGINFGAHACQRGYTVGSCVGQVIWHYNRALNRNYASLEEQDAAMHSCHLRCALITRHALERNAGLFIKIGQHISALTYVLPEEWTKTMIPLQDRCPVSSFESIVQMFEEDEGETISDVFSEFSHTPLGTASLAQVHKARLRSNGAEVAVKVQHPSLARYVPLDVALVDLATRLADYFFPQYPLRWLSDELQHSIWTELDFRAEARNAERTQEYFKPYYSQTRLHVPKVYWAHKRLLTMEYVTGIRPDDLPALEAAGIDRAALSSAFAHLFDNMIFTPGVGLHCDPHAGNIAVRPLPNHDFEVILYDHGLYRYISTPMRRAYAHLWLALIDGDQPGMKHWAHEFAGVDGDEFRLFAAAITGRDFDNAVTNVVSQRSRNESERMALAVQDQGLLAKIMQLLSHIPDVVLLIFKTNDLVRYLDQKLDSPLGTVRTFLIMAQYCASTVYDEERETLYHEYGNQWTPRRLWLELAARWRYWRRGLELRTYDIATALKLTSLL